MTGSREGKAAALEVRVAMLAAAAHPLLRGPFRVVSVARGPGDRVDCQVSAFWLVGVDPTEPALRDIWVPVPVAGSVALHENGGVIASAFPEPGPEDIRQARIFARDLIARGSVQGVPGSAEGRPAARPTHELTTESDGRRVLRRLGFDAS
jgi:hypothetical protein